MVLFCDSEEYLHHIELTALDSRCCAKSASEAVHEVMSRHLTENKICFCLYDEQSQYLVYVLLDILESIHDLPLFEDVNEILKGDNALMHSEFVYLMNSDKKFLFKIVCSISHESENLFYGKIL